MPTDDLPMTTKSKYIAAPAPAAASPAHGDVPVHGNVRMHGDVRLLKPLEPLHLSNPPPKTPPSTGQMGTCSVQDPLPQKAMPQEKERAKHGNVPAAYGNVQQEAKTKETAKPMEISESLRAYIPKDFGNYDLVAKKAK